MQISEFKDAVGKFPTGVCVISTYVNNKLWGFTANSFVSVSLSPPLISFCLDKSSGSLNAFKETVFFAINILSSNQEEISKHFAHSSTDKFIGINYSLSQFQTPHIHDSISFLECKKYEMIDGGDHIIFMGEVVSVQVDETKTPLLYYAKAYRDMK
ncbi:MAG: flavin reductase [Rickettsiales bacterium]|nr:MAG: flavin reductase [Rickettsiales bacterium]